MIKNKPDSGFTDIPVSKAFFKIWPPPSVEPGCVCTEQLLGESQRWADVYESQLRFSKTE